MDADEVIAGEAGQWCGAFQLSKPACCEFPSQNLELPVIGCPAMVIDAATAATFWSSVLFSSITDHSACSFGVEEGRGRPGDTGPLNPGTALPGASAPPR